jgi:hypothetical protein
MRVAQLHRKLWAVDLENIAGCSPLDATPQMYADALAALADVVPVQADDLMIVATNPRLAFVAHDLAPAARLLIRTGPNGADNSLVEELSDIRFLARRFSHIVVVSGDKAFVDVVCALNEVGVHTMVVSLPGQLSATLRFAARTVVWLPTPNHGQQVATAQTPDKRVSTRAYSLPEPSVNRWSLAIPDDSLCAYLQVSARHGSLGVVRGTSRHRHWRLVHGPASRRKTGRFRHSRIRKGRGHARRRTRSMNRLPSR